MMLRLIAVLGLALTVSWCIVNASSGTECGNLYPLSKLSCTKNCKDQTCEDFINGGEKTDCNPAVDCEEGCGCPDGQKIDLTSPQEGAVICVDKDKCGCVEGNYYARIGYPIKKGNKMCECKGHNNIDSASCKDFSCEFFPSCPFRCATPDRRVGCYRCRDPPCND